jgi:hypothetical protein
MEQRRWCGKSRKNPKIGLNFFILPVSQIQFYLRISHVKIHQCANFHGKNSPILGLRPIISTNQKFMKNDENKNLPIEMMR